MFKWVQTLCQKYPDDIGILSPAILNLVTLDPGEALFLPAGELHAYLYGLGIELMANSDNVLRGGLTPKHIDPPELLTVLNFQERDIDILLPENTASGERVYPVFAKEFFLSVITLDPGYTYIAPEKHSADILLFTSGAGSITYGRNNAPVQFSKGTSVLIPAIVDSYRVSGNAVIYKAGVPL
jgi:mannose-6-phosphate isomerase